MHGIKDTMDELSGMTLGLLAPPELNQAAGAWQQRQSVQTKIAILDATVRCLAQNGYARTTQQQICEESGVSRGGLQHHYGSHIDLMSSVADYSFFKRMKLILDQVKVTPESERDILGLEAMWSSLNCLEYEAYLELAVAARTDPALLAMLQPKAERFDKAWHEAMYTLFPLWTGREKLFDTCKDFFQICLDGFSLNAPFWDNAARKKTVKHIIYGAMIALRDEVLDNGLEKTR